MLRTLQLARVSRGGLFWAMLLGTPAALLVLGLSISASSLSLAKPQVEPTPVGWRARGGATGTPASAPAESPKSEASNPKSPATVEKSTAAPSTKNLDAASVLANKLRQSSSTPASKPPAQDADNPSSTVATPTGGDSVADESSAGEDSDATSPEAENLPAMTPKLEALRDQVRSCLDFYYTRLVNARDNSHWEIMHAMLAYGVDTQIYSNAPGGDTVNAIRWLCGNGQCRKLRMLSVQGNGPLVAVGPGFQGHGGQFLAMLAQSRVMTDYPLLINGKSFTVQDLIETEQRACRPRTELTFRLISMAHYLDSEDTWKDDRGTEWSIPRLMTEEMAQPINGATCGGTHRLMGLSYAVIRRQQQGKPVDGVWKQALEFTQRYQKVSFNWQNGDGSLSTRYFRGPGDRPSLDRRVETTGHILEWLVYSLPADRLIDDKTVKAVHYLSETMIRNRYYAWPNGPRGHALHALTLYDQRAFGSKPGQRVLNLAKSDKKSEDR